MKESRKFGWPVPFGAGRIKVAFDGEYLSVRAWGSGRARARAADVARAGLSKRSVGMGAGHFIDLYDSHGTVLGSARMSGTSGKMEKALEYIGDLLARHGSGAIAGPATAPAASVSDRLRELATLRDQGLITAEEFEAKKAELLAGM